VVASYFDVDGTLVSTNLVHPTLYYLANQETPWKSLATIARTALRAPALALAEARDRRLFNEMLFQSFEGISEDRLRLLADDAFDTVLKPALFKGARDLIARCRERGEVILISGALDFLIERLCEDLGATGFIANRLEIKDRRATGRLLRPVVAGPEKARLIRDHAREHQHDLDHCFAYSDSYSDVPMLSIVGHPAAVNPDAKLRRLAEAYGWPTMTLRA
jgi:HAD superfamily hydrolase (TIGR01490 family)